MEISCPSCQNRFEAVTRRAVCTSCGTQFDVWALVSGYATPPPPPKPPPISRGESSHSAVRDPYSTNLLAESSETVLDLPLAEITPEHAAEENPVLEPSLSALPREFAEIASPTSVADESPAGDDQGAYRTNVDAPQPESSGTGIVKWLIAFVALTAAVVLGVYLLREPANGDLAATTNPTIAPEPGPTSSVEPSPFPASSTPPAPSPSPALIVAPRVSPTPTPAEATPQPRTDESQDAQTRARAVNPQQLTNAKYTLQIAAKPTEGEARQVAQKMIEAGLDARIVRATVATANGESKTWFRVRVGAFATKGDAIQYGEQLKRGGRIEGYFVTDLR